MMLDDILAARIDNPDVGRAGSAADASASSSMEEMVIGVVKRLVEFNGLDQ